MKKPRLSVHKFTSCDGCQLALLNAGDDLFTLSNLVDIVHFAEAGEVDTIGEVDISIIEGSITTPDEVNKIQTIRDNSKYLISIGACATAGGIQALRNFANHEEWMKAIYASPDYIESLNNSFTISHYVKVDYEIWGCPINTKQILYVIRSLLSDASPQIKRDSVCMECKRNGNVCVMVTKNQSCMGPVTQAGCGAICPSVGRACYACYGPKENANPMSLGMQFQEIGLSAEQVAKQYLHINNQAPAFKNAGLYFKGIKIVKE